MPHLPDLIRKGARETRPHSQEYISRDRAYACVIGAAAIGLRGAENCPNSPRFWDEFTRAIDEGAPRVDLEKQPQMIQKYASGFGKMKISTAMARMNDRGLSRSDIAKWLEETFSEEALHVPANSMGPVNKEPVGT